MFPLRVTNLTKSSAPPLPTRAIAMFSFTGLDDPEVQAQIAAASARPDESPVLLAFRAGESIFKVVPAAWDGWCQGVLGSNKAGIFPAAFVCMLEPTYPPEEPGQPDPVAKPRKKLAPPVPPREQSQLYREVMGPSPVPLGAVASAYAPAPLPRNRLPTKPVPRPT